MKPGDQLGPYEILEPLGAGGMGEVYRARDPRLDRDVAIKVLPEDFAADAGRLARFEREAKLLAQLSHSNIAGIYGLEDADGVRFIAMECVEGETLAERLAASGRLDVDDSLEIARQIAEALEAAHESGIVHRDLKPANVIASPDGKVKVLDFGLAKAWETESSAGTGGEDVSPDLSHSPTIIDATRTGVILGTAAYMSPEQARGKPVDKRADIWAFGCVLFEMLAGKRAFHGETVSDTMAAILKEEPDWNAVAAATPSSVSRVLHRCLKKDPRQRLHDIADARIEIEESAGVVDFSAHSRPSTPEASAPNRLPWAIAAAGWIAVVTVSLAWNPWANEAPLAPRMSSYSINLPPDAPMAPTGAMPFGVGKTSLVISPDGSNLVYVALVDGERQLYVRDMETGEIEAILGTAGASGPFFSPDGQAVGFFASERLMTVSLSGGTPLPLADASDGAGGAWVGDTIYYSHEEGTGLRSVPASSGEVEEVTSTGPEGTHTWPSATPDSDTLLLDFGIRGVADVRLSESDRPELLVEFAFTPRYVSSGHLLFGRPGRLNAVAFDLETRETSGSPVSLVEDLRTDQWLAHYTISQEGTLVYAPGIDGGEGVFTWVDRGEERTVPLGLPQARYAAFEISDDGERLVLTKREGRDQDVWVHELARLNAPPVPLTSGGVHQSPLWMDSGDSLLITRDNGDDFELLWASVAGETLPLMRSDTWAIAHTFAPDGGVVYARQSEGGGDDIWLAPLEAGPPATLDEQAAVTIIETVDHELFPKVSPDGNWITYTSNRSGRWEIYVAPFPDVRAGQAVSTIGGEEARWNPDGSELIYRWGSQWFAVDVTLGSEFAFGDPRLLFEGPYINVEWYSWAMMPDGERFLVLEGPQQDEPVWELKVLTNFFGELQRQVPTGR